MVNRGGARWALRPQLCDVTEASIRACPACKRPLTAASRKSSVQGPYTGAAGNVHDGGEDGGRENEPGGGPAGVMWPVAAGRPKCVSNPSGPPGLHMMSAAGVFGFACQWRSGQGARSEDGEERSREKRFPTRGREKKKTQGAD